jgi:hypothetical protein
MNLNNLKPDPRDLETGVFPTFLCWHQNTRMSQTLRTDAHGQVVFPGLHARRSMPWKRINRFEFQSPEFVGCVATHDLNDHGVSKRSLNYAFTVDEQKHCKWERLKN